MIQFPSKLDQIVLTLSDLGYEAFYVGGCVRDAILNRETFDVDISTNANMDILMEVFKTYKLTKNEALGALSFRIDNYNIEITRFRKEDSYIDHRRPSFITFECSAKEDIMRRDFTINGLMYHPNSGLIDYVDGLRDLKQGILRCIGDSDIKFNEDYLRMLRLMRFKAQLGFEIEPNTLSSCISNYNKLGLYSNRAWRDEFFKLVMAPYFVKLVIDEPWLLGTLIPDIGKSVYFNQRNPYHKYSLYEHTLLVMSNLSTLDLKLVGLFHDLGKLSTQVMKDGRGSYPNHAYAGAKLARVYFNDWEIPKTRREWMLNLIEHHDMSIDTDYIAFKKKVSEYGLEFMKDIVILKRADNLAKSDLAYYQVEKCNIFDSYIEKIEIEKPVLFISDLDIKGSQLDVDSKMRGEILGVLLERVIEGLVDNEFDMLMKEVEGIKDELY